MPKLQTYVTRDIFSALQADANEKGLSIYKHLRNQIETQYMAKAVLDEVQPPKNSKVIKLG